MNKTALRQFAVRKRQLLEDSAVSSGMTPEQAQEAAYFCFMYRAAESCLTANGISHTPTEIIPAFQIHPCLEQAAADIQFSDLIAPSEWKQISLLGWLHQYYQFQMKNTVFAGKKHKQIAEKDIPAATQFFTPEWLVKYMIQNTLGRLCHAPETEQAYFLGDDAGKKSNPEQIKILDPCMGTGHILVYAFDMLMQMYLNAGTPPESAVRQILKHHLYGLELDRYACETARFILITKALLYDKTFLKSGIRPNFAFFQGEPAGSLLTESENPVICQMLKAQYDIVVTNPPYMGSSGMPEPLSEFVRMQYPDSYQNLYACFMERCSAFAKPGGYLAMLNMHGWMFLPSFEALRKKMLKSHVICSLLHLGAYAFDTSDVGTIVQSACFVMKKQPPAREEGIYLNLCDYRDTEQKHQIFLHHQAETYRIAQEQFFRIPGSPLIYQASEQIFRLFQMPKLGETAEARQGLTTSDNRRFIRLWHEVDYTNICFHARNHEQAMQSHKKWFPYHKGGGYRKWYGNHSEVINYEDNGRELNAFHEKLNRKHPGGRLKNKKYYFRESITWTFIALTPGFRYNPEGFLFDVAGSSLFTEDDREYLLAFLCSSVARYLLYLLNPTMNIQTRDIKLLPYLRSDSEHIDGLAEENIRLCQEDWDSFETSWNFKRHPLI